jgi:ABC-type phosphate/phosphonate transport system substrate-binding protein
MRASLPMYNLPEMRPANTSFWLALRAELALAGAPEALDFSRLPVPGEIEADTLFTQVCGYPLQKKYRGQARMLGVPTYALPHCGPSRHAGVFVVRGDAPYRSLADLRGCHFVFNSLDSNSGMNLPRRAIADIADGGAFFGSCVETHSQPGNLDRVAAGEADATCVDCVTWAFNIEHKPHLRALRVLGATPESPAIPFVTAMATPEPLFQALQAALLRVGAAPEHAATRAGLHIAAIAVPDGVDYPLQLRYEDDAAALGYPHLQ